MLNNHKISVWTTRNNKETMVQVYNKKKIKKEEEDRTTYCIIHKSDAPTQHWLFFITNNQSCVPVNPEIGRKISYIEV